MTGAEKVLAAILGVAGVLALLELVFVLFWRFAPLHAPWPLDPLMARHPRLRSLRHVVARYIGVWLALAPRKAIRNDVRKLFHPELLMDNRSDSRWQVWYNVHIPAFIVAGARRGRAAVVVEAVMNGLADATRALVEEARRAGVQPVSFDSFWRCWSQSRRSPRTSRASRITRSRRRRSSCATPPTTRRCRRRARGS